MEQHVIELLREKNLLKNILLLPDIPVLRYAIEDAGGQCITRDGIKLDVVVVVEAAESQSDAWKSKASKWECPVLIVEGNAGWMPLAMAALSGSQRFGVLREICGRPVFTEASLEEHMKRMGFRLCAKNDKKVEPPENNLEENAFEAKGALLHQTVCAITEATVLSSSTIQFVRLYYPDKSTPKTQKGYTLPFLTVVMRTQGTRIEALREAFLCLSAQEDTDFEVVLVGHKVSEENRKELDLLLEELPPSMKKRVRYYLLDKGGRSAPLNYGFERAKGKYIAAFDDDDLLMANWVSGFKQAHIRMPGSILHVYAVGQDWKSVLSRGENGLQSISGYNKRFCTNYHWTRQMHTNYCPLMTLAFPAYAFRAMGQRFDETLEITEDWDFLLRTAWFCGVEDESVVAAVYRLWSNTTTSYTLHDQPFWENQYKRIIHRNKMRPILLPCSASEELWECHENELTLLRNYQDEFMGYTPKKDRRLKKIKMILLRTTPKWFFLLVLKAKRLILGPHHKKQT